MVQTATAERLGATQEVTGMEGSRLYQAVGARIDDTYDLTPLSDLACYMPDSNELMRNETFAAEDAASMARLVEMPGSGPSDLLRHFQMLESDRETGSFKEQGAFLACLEALNRDPALRTFVAFSAGNHGLGMARFVNWYNRRLVAMGVVRADAAGRPLDDDRHLLATAHIFCKQDASSDKKASIQARGEAYDDVVLHDQTEAGVGYTTLEVAQTEAQRFIENRSQESQPAFLVHPFADITVMAGQANSLLSAVVQARNGGVDLANTPLVFAVAGGGLGLADGCGVMMDKLVRLGVLHHDSRILVTQMEGCDSALRGIERLDAGRSDMQDLFIEAGGDVFVPAIDGTAVKEPHVPNLELARYLRELHVMDFVRVSMGEVGQEMRRARAEDGITKEPAGALAGAGLRKVALELLTFMEGAILVDVVSGRNCSAETLAAFTRAADEMSWVAKSNSLQPRLGEAVLSAAVTRVFVRTTSLPATRH